jgi:hypothetical protein
LIIVFGAVSRFVIVSPPKDEFFKKLTIPHIVTKTKRAIIPYAKFFFSFSSGFLINITTI